MLPEKWQRIKRIFESAAELEPERREAFILEACAGDEEMAGELRSLLTAHESAGEFIQAPAAESVAIAEHLDSALPYERLGPYRLLERIGAGGMGSVYLAERDDKEFRKRVAIKVVSRGMNTDFILRRFRQERQILAGLSHPNITMLLDGGATPDGLPYFVMELVEGQPILAYCEERGLTLRERLELFRTVCEAVQYAHRNRVVHRDVKPSNILVTPEGIPKLLDFGIARMFETGADGRVGEQTLLTRSLMTPEYASPEQVRGEPATPASDIYSLGVVLYELLTRRLPYRVETPTPQAIAVAVCEQEPEKPSAAALRPTTHSGKPRASEPPKDTDLGRSLRGDLDSIVLMTLSKEPGRRYASASEFSEDIRRHLAGLPVQAREGSKPYRAGKFILRHRGGVTAAVLAIIILLVGVAIWMRWPGIGTRQSGAGDLSPNSIVVLPFANLSGDPENEYLSDGLTEELIGALAAVPELRVVARTSAFQFKGRNEDIRKIGRDLSVRMALEGSVRRAGQRIRIAAQLVNVSDGMHLWSKTYDRDMTSLLEVEDELTRAIVEALKVRLAVRQPGKAETTSIQAHELYLKGRYFWNKMTPGDLKKSIESMEQAIALDRNYAAAYAGLSDAYGFLANLELEGPWEYSARSRSAAQKALELDDSLAEGHFVMGAVLAYDWDWSDSEREFRRALDLKPSLIWARGSYAGLCLAPLRRYKDAIAQFRQALEVDPLSVSLRTFLGQTHIYAGRPDEGIREVRSALEMEPGFPMGLITLALGHLEKSSYLEALHVLQPAKDSAGDIPYYSGLLGYTHARLGNRVEAERVLEQLKARFRGPWVPPVEVAGIYNALGDREQALRWLERGCRQRSIPMLFIIDDPRFRNLYSEPRFQSVLGRMGLSRYPGWRVFARGTAALRAPEGQEDSSRGQAKRSPR